MPMTVKALYERKKLQTSKSLLMGSIVALLAISIPVVAYADIYGYQAIKPSGSAWTEVTHAKGTILGLLDTITTADRHIDRLVYVYDPFTAFTAGTGYYTYTDSSNNSFNHYYKFRHLSGTDMHVLRANGPSTNVWFDAEIIQKSSTEYQGKINGQDIGSMFCTSGDCPDPTIAGSASWGDGSTSEMNVKAKIKTLQFKRDIDSTYQNWQGNNSLYKCKVDPSSINFDLPTNSNVNEYWIEINSQNECNYAPGDHQWLFSGGNGG